MEHSPSWEADLVKKFLAFYGTQMFITVFTRDRQAGGPPIVGCQTLHM
jgi:hypothetical protein